MAMNTGGDGGPARKRRRTNTKQSEMLPGIPELPNEVWTLVLDKLEAVGDWGRLQQVSRTFNAAIADVGWTKIKSLRSEFDEINRDSIFVDKQQLWLPTEKRLLLVEELAKKAVNVTQVLLQLAQHYTWGKPEPEPEPIAEYMEFLGGVLEKLASGPQEIHIFSFDGDLFEINPVFPSLAQFIRANTKTLEKICIRDFAWDESHSGNEPRSELQFPPELLEAIRDCAQLHTADLCFDCECGLCGMDVPLLESFLTGKKHLTKLIIHVSQPEDVPVSVILDSGIQLVEFGCESDLLVYYEEELGRRGLAATDQHPLLTVKKLTIEDDLIPSFSLMPNLEHLQAANLILDDIEGNVYYDLISDFLTEYRNTAGDLKVLTCDIKQVDEEKTGQIEELMALAQVDPPCEASVTALDDSLVFARGNASIRIIYRIEEDESDDQGSDSDSSEEEGSDSDSSAH